MELYGSKINHLKHMAMVFDELRRVRLSSVLHWFLPSPMLTQCLRLRQTCLF